MVELNKRSFQNKDPLRPLKENLGTILTAIIVIICILTSIRMQKGSAPQRIQAQQGVALDMAPSAKLGNPRQSADSLPGKRSSLEVRPIWGNVRGMEKPHEEEKPEPEVEEEPYSEPEIEQPKPQVFKAPDMSDLMKGVNAATPKMKKAEFGATTQGGSKSSGGGGFQRVTSFGEQERAERAKREEQRKSAGPPIGGNKNSAEIRRLTQAIQSSAAPESLQKFGLDVPKLYELQEAGHDMTQYISADGTLSISDQDAASMAGHLGISNSGPDAKTSDSSIRGGRAQ